MKTKLKLSGLFLAALMLFSLTACGKDSPEPSSTSEETEQTKPARGSGKRNNDSYQPLGSYLR